MSLRPTGLLIASGLANHEIRKVTRFERQGMFV